MILWILYLLICVVFYFIESIIDEKHKSKVSIVFVIFITIISMFRYNIGFDYSAYTRWYYTELDYGNVFEPFFVFTVNILNYFEFKAQMLFVIYALLTNMFIYLGCRYYNRNTIYPLILYSIIPMFYWNYQSIIRQALAISIILWATKFIIEKKIFKYIAMVCIASMIHYAGVFAMIGSAFLKIKLSKKNCLLIVFLAMALGMSGVAPATLSVFFGWIFDSSKYIGYLNNVNEGSESIIFKIMMQLMLWFAIFSVIKFEKLSEKMRIYFSMYTLGTAIYFLTIDIVFLGRLKLFYDIFMIFIIDYVFKNFKYKNQQYLCELLFILAISIYFFFTLSSSNSLFLEGAGGDLPSAYNINYQFDFDVW